jgi:hypothetical protein
MTPMTTTMMMMIMMTMARTIATSIKALAVSQDASPLALSRR